MFRFFFSNQKEKEKEEKKDEKKTRKYKIMIYVEYIN